MTQPTEPLSPAPPSPDTGKGVQVYNPSGALVSIPAAQLPDAQAQGYSVAPATKPEAPLSFETVQAGIGGAFQGATAGLFEPFEQGAENAIGGLFGHPDWGTKNIGERMHRLEEEHPTATTVGEGLGMVGGTLAGEGLIAQGGRAALTAGRGLAAISRTGELAGSLVGRAGAGLAATGALGRAAVAGAELGARGAVEMGLYNSARELNEQMLGDPALNAEKIFAAAADGAEGGAIFGGALGAAGSLAKSGVSGLGSIASDVISKNAGKLDELANEQRWRALDPLKKFTEQANARVEGGTKAVGEVLGRYGIVGDSLESAIKSGDVESIASKLDVAVEKVGQQLGDLTGASTATVPLNKINDALEGVIAPLRKTAGFEGVVRSLEDYRISLANKLVPDAAAMGEAAVTAPISLQDALFQRKGLDQLVYNETKSLDPKMRVQLLRDFRGKFEGLIVDAFDDAAKAAGNPGARAELLGLKKDYQALSLSQDAAEKATSRMQTNRNLSISDYMAGGTGSHIGGAIGSILGPVGAAVGSGLGGIAGAALNKLGREKGNAIAAAVLKKLGEYGKKLGPVKGAELEALAAQVTRAEEAAHAPELHGGIEPRRLPENAGPTPLGDGLTANQLEGAREYQVAGSRMLPEFTERPEVGPPRLMAPRPEAPGLEPMPMAPEIAGAPERPRMGVRPEADIGPEPTHPGVPEKPIAPKPTAAKAEKLAPFEERLTDAIHHLDRNGERSTMVHLLDLRKEFPEMSREQFDAALWKADKENRIKLATYNGRRIGDAQSGGLTQERLDAALTQKRKTNSIGGQDLYDTTHYGYVMPNGKPSGKPWARASEAGSPKVTKAAQAKYEKAYRAWSDKVDEIDLEHLDRVEAYQAKKAAAEKAVKDWEAGNASAEGGFTREFGDWQARKAAAESGHAGAMSEWNARRMATEEAHAAQVEKWSADIQRAAAEHSALLEKVAQFERARAAIAKVDEQVTKAAKGIVLGPGEVKALPQGPRADKLALRAESGMTLRERYAEATKAVQDMQENQATIIKRASVEATHMPDISKLLGTNALRAFMYMTTQTPAPINQSPILGKALPARASDADMTDYMAKFNTARDPVSTLRKFARGRVTTAEAQTLQIVSPELFKELQQKSMALVIDRQAAGDPLPFQARQRMHVLLGVQTDPSQDPKLTRALQDNLVDADQPTQGAQAPGGAPQARPKRPVDMPDITNKFDKLESM